MYNFDKIKPEEFLALLINWKIATDGTGTTSPSGHINYLFTLLSGSSLREFDKLELQRNTTNNHLKLITKGLLE